MIKKLALLLTSTVIVAGIMMSCGNEQVDETVQQDTEASETVADELNTAFDYKTADLTEYVKVCNYKGLNVEKKVVSVTEADIDAEIEKIRDEHSDYEHITDRAVEEGDTVIADYAGYNNGVAFNGGTATDQEIKATPNSGYIEGFSEAFVGQIPGEEFSFNVTFPEDYHSESLAGVEVTFVCTVKYIRGPELIVPEIDEAFIMENYQCNTMEDFRAMIADSIAEHNDYVSTNSMYGDIYDKIISNSTFFAYPEGEVERLYEEYTSMYKTYAERYGMEYDVFMQTYVGMTDDELKEEVSRFVREDLVMYSLINEMNVELTDTEYNERLEFVARMYGVDAATFEQQYGKEGIKTNFLWEKVMGNIAELANITEVTE